MFMRLRAWRRAPDKAGAISAKSTVRMPITTSNSTSVNPRCRLRFADIYPPLPGAVNNGLSERIPESYEPNTTLSALNNAYSQDNFRSFLPKKRHGEHARP